LSIVELEYYSRVGGGEVRTGVDGKVSEVNTGSPPDLIGSSSNVRKRPSVRCFNLWLHGWEESGRDRCK
jgi:hypothetical protein